LDHHHTEDVRLLANGPLPVRSQLGGTVRGWFKKATAADCAVVIRVDTPSA